MKYITGRYAMSLYADTDDMSTGIWSDDNSKTVPEDHMADTEDYPFGSWGIIEDVSITDRIEGYNVANCQRAYLDMLYDKRFKELEGLYDEAINYHESLHNILFKVFKFKLYEDKEICEFLAKEFDSQFTSFIMTYNLQDIMKKE